MQMHYGEARRWRPIKVVTRRSRKQCRIGARCIGAGCIVSVHARFGGASNWNDRARRQMATLVCSCRIIFHAKRAA